MRPARFLLLVFGIFTLCAFSIKCSKDPQLPGYKTKHVIIVVVDGARYQETWGNGELTYIPHRAQLSQQGTMLTNFQNAGYTYTNAGHTAMVTGYNEMINNSGYQLPQHPSIFQYWRKATGAPPEKAWVITSKDKLYILSDCYDSTFAGQYRPNFDCGVNGPFTGYRDDSVTFAHAMNVFHTWHPDMVLINFKEPDASAHSNNWYNYLQGIVNTDNYVGQLWDYLQSDPYYKGTTTLFVTNDHGRHNDGWSDEFVSHGDDCSGCHHIELLAMGPDFKQNFVCEENYNLCDIPKTISQLMLFPMNTGTGQTMKKLFKHN